MATKMISVLLLVLLFSCHANDNAQKTRQQENTLIATKLFEDFNKHDWAAMASLYSDTAWFKDPSFGVVPIHQTRQQTIDKYLGYQNVSANITDSVTGVYPSGETHITVEFISTGTTADGKQWEKPICTILTIENGLITNDNTYYDNFHD